MCSKAFGFGVFFFIGGSTEPDFRIFKSNFFRHVFFFQMFVCPFTSFVVGTSPIFSNLQFV